MSTVEHITEAFSAAPRRIGILAADSTRLFYILSAVQIFILFLAGSSLFSLFVLFTIESLCYFVMFYYGKSDINAGIVLSVALFHIVLASLVKIILFQSLDDNLIEPLMTELVVLIFFITLVIAYFLAKLLPIVFVTAPAEPSIKSLGWLTLLTFSLSMAAELFGGATGDFGNIAVTNFWGVLTRGMPNIAIGAAITLTLKKSDRKKLLDLMSGGIIAIFVIIGISHNSREGVLAPVVTAFLTAIYRGYRFRLREFAVAGVFVAFTAFVISPALLLVRADREHLSPIEIAEKSLETALLIAGGDAATKADITTPLDAVEYSIWGRYFGTQVPFADRIGLIQTVDVMVSASTGDNYVDIGLTMTDFVEGLLPDSVLAILGLHLDRIISPMDAVATSLGLEREGVVAALTIPIDGAAYAMGGIPSVISQTFVAFLILFYIIRILTGKVKEIGFLSICIFTTFYRQVSELDYTGILYQAARIIPQFYLTYRILNIASEILAVDMKQHKEH